MSAVTEPAAPAPTPTSCPWCSAPLPGEGETSCPSCGATLIGGPDASVPGVTSLDPEAIVRAARTPVPERRSRLLGWITGEDSGDDETPAAPGSLEPPPPEVRREMLRMQLEAEVADLQAEVGSLASEAREEGLKPDEQALEAVADDLAELEEEVADDAPADDATTDGASTGAPAAEAEEPPAS
jgi:hypothetical protein